MKLQEFYHKIGTEYSGIIERFYNNEQLILKVVLAFAKDDTYQKLSDAVNAAQANYEDIEKCAHTLKGVAANLGFERLCAASAELVMCVRENRYEAVSGNFDRVTEEYEAVINAITEVI